MSPDEVGALIFSMVILTACAYKLLTPLLSVEHFGRHTTKHYILAVAPIANIAILFYVLRTLASHDVINDGKYIFMYLMMGLAWVGFFQLHTGFVGVSYRDDAVERGNFPACIISCAAQTGLTFCFAGGNIGNGPGWWVVVLCAMISTGALFAAWWVVEQGGHLSESITIGRDPASALRASGWIIGLGLLFGRGVAGDWVSFNATLADFGPYALYGLLVATIAFVIEILARPSIRNPHPSMILAGFLPGSLFLIACVAITIMQGPVQSVVH